MSLYTEFRQLLDNKQRSVVAGDIRYRVIAAAQLPAAFSFVGKILANEYPRNLSLLFARLIASDATDHAMKKAENFFLLGALSESNPKVNRGWISLFKAMKQSPDKGVYFMEQGFIASVESWAPQFRSKPESACLGYVYDDIAQYYMAEYPNRLIRKLNSADEISAVESARAQALIGRIVERKISKYNNQPLAELPFLNDPRRKVLVCDQSYADASTVFGLIDDSGFERMLDAAVEENPGAQIIVKTHPDTSWQRGVRSGYYNHLEGSDSIEVLREPVNPFQLFELVDTVYVGTSQMGLEALLAGKKVVCFGAPFYAGWGFTDDRIPIPHRGRTRALDSLFFYFYLWYTIYQVPDTEVPAQLEDALDYIERHRSIFVPLPAAPAPQKPPRVSVIIPVYGVAPYLEAALVSAQKQSLADLEIIAVDDCSVDGSAVILRRLAATDPRIRPLFLPANVGQGFARNEGMKLAQGDYIWFLDGDDYFSSRTHLADALAAAMEHHADLVRCRKRIERVEDAAGVFRENRPDVVERYFNRDVHGVSYATYPELLHNRHFCNFLYRREFLQQHSIWFRTPQWEERAFVLNALLQAEKISSIDSDAFVYRIRVDSTARREKTLRDTKFMLRNFNETVELLIEAGANVKSSPLHAHFCFNVTQFVHYIFRGFVYDLLSTQSDQEPKHRFLLEVGELLTKSNFDHRCLSDDPEVIDRLWLSTGRYALIVASLRAARLVDLDKAVRGDSYTQSEIFTQFIAHPNSEFTDALNLYAKNDRVRLANVATQRCQLSNIRVIIHIGSSKAGSTFLQHWLDENRPALLAQGIYYPEVGLFWQANRPEKTAGHAPFLRAAIKDEPSLLRHIESGIVNASGRIHTVLLSSEAFFLNKNATMLAKYFRHFSLKMLVYLRRQDEWANSQYCEFVGGGAVGRVSESPREWLALNDTKAWLSYRTLLQKWEDAIGLENVIVRPFEKNQLIGHSIETDFSARVGITNLTKFNSTSDTKRNTAVLNKAYIELLLIINRFSYRSQDAYFSCIEEVHQVFRAYHPGAPKTVYMFDEATRREVLEFYQNDNIDIARRYLAREDGVLFEATSIVRGDTEDAEKAVITAEELSQIQQICSRYSLDGPKAGQRPVKDREKSSENYNYGIFAWRRRLLLPLLIPLIHRYLSLEEFEAFKRDPAGFVRIHDTWKNKLTRWVFFP